MIPNVSYYGLLDKIMDETFASKLYNDSPVLLDFVKEVIKRCDLGLQDVKINSKKEEDGSEVYFPVFSFLVGGKEESLTFRNQSSGTKSLYLQLGLYKIAIDVGGLLVLDEFDINLHPHILPILLDMFTDEKLNPNNAQIIFTTHNVEILDFLGKYRTILVNKEENQCYGYRLDEIPGDVIRNDRPLAPVYNSGKIGGVPRV
jgi:AAA15 family ATPase/GTPase